MSGRLEGWKRLQVDGANWGAGCCCRHFFSRAQQMRLSSPLHQRILNNNSFQKSLFPFKSSPRSQTIPSIKPTPERKFWLQKTTSLPPLFSTLNKRDSADSQMHVGRGCSKLSVLGMTTMTTSMFDGAIHKYGSIIIFLPPCSDFFFNSDLLSPSVIIAVPRRVIAYHPHYTNQSS